MSVQDPPATALRDAPPPRVFPGWWVVAGVFVMLMVTAGIGFYGLSVYLRALTVEQGFSVGAVSGATAVFFLVGGLTGLPVAAWTARRDVRPVVALGAVACGAALLLLGRVTEVWHVYVAYALFGAGFSAASLVPGTTLVTRWFVRRRSVALSVASTGLSAGGVFLTPFIASLLDDRSLRDVAPWLAVAIVVGTVPVTAALLKPSPQALGLQPDGDPVPPPGSPLAPLGPLVRDAIRTRFFVAVTAAHLLAMLAQVGGIAHLYNLAAERVDTALAASAVSVLAVSSLVGRLLGGAVAARVSMRRMAVVLMGVQAASLLALAAVGGTVALLLSTVAFGLTVGNLLMLHPLLLAERFGVRDYARIYSRSQLVATFGVAARVSMRLMAVVLMGVQAASLLALAAVGGTVALLLSTVAFGLTVGNLLMLHPLLLAERFGVRDYARIYSRSQLVATFGVAAGPAAIGVLHDAVDGYGAAFALAAAASVVAGVVLSLSGPTRGAVTGSPA